MQNYRFHDSVNYWELLVIKAIYPKQNLSIPNKQHKKYPYLLRGLKIDHVNQVRASDIEILLMKSITKIMDF
ncbi:MAG: putative transposase [Candidatus Cloacimonadota bacterium]|jgi:hypothetical protein|nr:putative transposase [Candidatus Cloacimonadota bacterium]